MRPERTKANWLTVRSLIEGLREQHVANVKGRGKHSVFLYHRPSDDQFVVEYKVEHPNGKSKWVRTLHGRDIAGARRAYGRLAKSIQTTG